MVRPFVSSETVMGLQLTTNTFAGPPGLRALLEGYSFMNPHNATAAVPRA